MNDSPSDTVRDLVNMARGASRDSRDEKYPSLIGWNQGRKVAFLTAARLVAADNLGHRRMPLRIEKILNRGAK